MAGFQQQSALAEEILAATFGQMTATQRSLGEFNQACLTKIQEIEALLSTAKDQHESKPPADPGQDQLNGGLLAKRRRRRIPDLLALSYP